jgi:hypothetical protein
MEKSRKKLLAAYDPPKLNQKDINHLNRSIIKSETESPNKERKAQDHMDSLLNSTRPLKKTKVPQTIP